MEGDHGGDVGKPNKYYLSHVFKVNIIMLILSMYPWYYVMKIALCGPPPRPHTHRLIIRKTSDKTQLGDSLQNNWPLVLKTIKVIYKKKKKKTRKKWETGQKRLRRPNDWMQFDILDGILEQNNVFVEKLVKYE